MKNKAAGYLFMVFLLLVIAAAAGCSGRLVPQAGASKVFRYDSASFDYIYSEALKQKLLGNPGDALKYLEQCIKLNPFSDAAYYQMAQIAFQQGNMQAGNRYALNAYRLDNKNIWYLTMLAGFYYQKRNTDSSLMFYERAIMLYPEREDLKFNAGNIYSEKGDFKKAEEIYSWFENKYGINETVTLMSVRNLINSGNFRGAEEKILWLIGIYPDNILYNGILAEIYRKSGMTEKAKGVYHKLLEIDPSGAQTLLSLSDFLLEEEMYDEMFIRLDSIILSDKVRWEDKISVFGKLIDNRKLASAKSMELERAMVLFEKTAGNREIVSLIRPDFYTKTGKTDLAVKRLEEIILENSNNYFAWEKLLILYSETGNTEKLYERSREAATKFNMSFPAKILYASAAMTKGLYNVALEEVRKAKVIAGSNNDAIVQAMTVEAEIFYMSGEYLKSFEIFREVLKIAPEDMILLNNFAYYLAEQNRDLKEAEAMITRVIEKEHSNSTFLDTYAWVLYKRGKNRKAIKIMKSIIENGSETDAEWLEHYGYMQKKKGNCREAVKYWGKALETDKGKTNLLKEIENCKR